MKIENFRVNSLWIKKLLYWANDKFSYSAYFNSNNIIFPYNGFENILFASNEATTEFSIGNNKNGYQIALLSYDLKNNFEKLTSDNKAYIESPEAVYFCPSVVVRINGNRSEIIGEDPEEIYSEVNRYLLPSQKKNIISPIIPLNTKVNYLDQVKNIQQHIKNGDIYEMNFCQGFVADFEVVNPLELYLALNDRSPMPFSSFFRSGDNYLVCASPERFIKKSGQKLIAQPIKGTVRRGKDPQEDLFLQEQLANSEKEKAENLMIVDLMRNDLSKISQTGTVFVEELFGIYGFKQISQMISTVSSRIEPNMAFTEIIRNSFPMGSMTGAPKIKSMELIDRYENFKRGWFSGSVGYIQPNGDFDFNVIIRSIIIDAKNKRLFFAVGSAITYDAIPEKEYEECLLKAKPIFEVLNQEHQVG